MPKKLTTEQWVEKAVAKHGDRYDYSLVEYGSNGKVPVKIICLEHGEFLQSPNSHLGGATCMLCSRDNKIGNFSEKSLERDREFLSGLPCSIYLMQLKDCYKIGITNNTSVRLVNLRSEGMQPRLLASHLSSRYTSAKLELFFLGMFKEFKFKHPDRFGGYTECYQFDGSHVKFITEMMEDLNGKA